MVATSTARPAVADAPDTCRMHRVTRAAARPPRRRALTSRSSERRTGGRSSAIRPIFSGEGHHRPAPLRGRCLVCSAPSPSSVGWHRRCWAEVRSGSPRPRPTGCSVRPSDRRSSSSEERAGSDRAEADRRTSGCTRRPSRGRPLRTRGRRATRASARSWPLPQKPPGRRRRGTRRRIRGGGDRTWRRARAERGGSSMQDTSDLGPRAEVVVRTGARPSRGPR